MSGRIWKLAGGRIVECGAAAHIVGILNVTPDSFSDGGRFAAPRDALAAAETMIAEGAAIIDVGGESTRPGASPVSAEEEQRRILPVVEALAARSDALVSVDTYRESTALMAIKAGAHILNDVWGLQREPAIARLAAVHGCGLVVMHTGRDRYRLEDPIADQFAFLERSMKIARDAGVAAEQIVLDPGFGFAKDPHENVALIARFAELERLGRPLLAGTSRKRFLGHVTGRTDPGERDAATAASSAILRLAGAALFRVHNVAMNADALRLADAILAERNDRTRM